MQSVALAKIKGFESGLQLSADGIPCRHLPSAPQLERSKRFAWLGLGPTISIWSTLLPLVTPLVFVSEASAQARIPGIVITETRYPPTCTSGACRDAVEQLLGLLKPNIPFNPERPEPDAIEVSQKQFCEALTRKKPASCPRTRPAIAGRDGAGGNGCGPGGLLNTIANLAASAGGIPSFSGDRDEPIRGLSFRASCNAHDVCYASQGGRQSCDTTFTDSMFSVCGTNQDCRSAAAAYSALVIRFGEKPYGESGTALQCYQWHVDMDAAGCGAQKSEITDAAWAE
jgi:hypothetical protein